MGKSVHCSVHCSLGAPMDPESVMEVPTDRLQVLELAIPRWKISGQNVGWIAKTRPTETMLDNESMAVMRTAQQLSNSL
jgi:hypothetical protein